MYAGYFDILSFKFDGDCFDFDKELPMGCSISCTAFEHFSTFLRVIAGGRLNSLINAIYFSLYAGSLPMNIWILGHRLIFSVQHHAAVGMGIQLDFSSLPPNQ